MPTEHERLDLIIHHTERLLAFSEAAAVHECRMQTCRDACAMPGADPRVEMREYEDAAQQRVEAMHGAVDAIGRLTSLMPDNAPMPRSVGCEASSFDLHNEARILAAYVEQMAGGISFDAALDAAFAGEDSAGHADAAPDDPDATDGPDEKERKKGGRKRTPPTREQIQAYQLKQGTANTHEQVAEIMERETGQTWRKDTVTRAIQKVEEAIERGELPDTREPENDRAEMRLTDSVEMQERFGYEQDLDEIDDRLDNE